MNYHLSDIKDQVSHFGVYGIILNQADNTILLIKKSRGPYTGMLDLPGGSPEFNETLEQTLCREILEETGLTVNAYKQLESILNIGEYGQINLRHVGVIYLVDASGKIKETTDQQDSEGSIWINISDIPTVNCTPFVKIITSTLKL